VRGQPATAARHGAGRRDAQPRHRSERPHLLCPDERCLPGVQYLAVLDYSRVQLPHLQAFCQSRGGDQVGQGFGCM
jgi:hypothetical protein